jgi:hypothetical protein
MLLSVCPQDTADGKGTSIPEIKAQTLTMKPPATQGGLIVPNKHPRFQENTLIW